MPWHNTITSSTVGCRNPGIAFVLVSTGGCGVTSVQVFRIDFRRIHTVWGADQGQHVRSTAEGLMNIMRHGVS